MPPLLWILSFWCCARMLQLQPGRIQEPHPEYAFSRSLITHLPDSSMHDIIDVPGENVAAVSLSGTLTEEDFHAVYPFIKDQIERHNTARFLFELDDVDGWEPEDVWDDFVFDVRHAHDADRIAVVSDDPWKPWMQRLGLAFPSAHVEVYEGGHRDDALEWLNGEDLEVDVPSPKGQDQ